jgi:hypothetical protein
MKSKILKVLEHSKNLIISPDADGIMTAELIHRYNGSQIVGTYDKNLLVLADGIDPTKCLFVDCDMNSSDYVSIGNHMRLPNDNISEKSFNPNIHFGVTNYTDKFPFATAFLIAATIEIPTTPLDHIRMAFADSTLKNMELYGDNMRNWSNKVECAATTHVVENTAFAKILDDVFRQSNVQSLTSRRYGKKRYIETLNKALESQIVPFLPLTKGKRYMTDKVGKNTVIKYNQDIMSYAEIYSGEYSVTYDQEIEWK